jgi:hypothetical protein
MDGLKAEIVAKRKAIQDDPINATRPTKYMRRGDIEKLREDQERKAREEKDAAKQTVAQNDKVCYNSSPSNQKSNSTTENRYHRALPPTRLVQFRTSKQPPQKLILRSTSRMRRQYVAYA